MLFFDSGDAGYLRELAQFVAVPSVSRDASHDTMRAAAQWLAGQLEFANGRVVKTDGHPVVLGEWLGADGAPTGRRPCSSTGTTTCSRRVRRPSGQLPRFS